VDGPVSILTLNSGSSSVKFGIFGTSNTDERLGEGAVERIGGAGGKLWMRAHGEQIVLERSQRFADHEEAIRAAFHAIEEAELGPPVAVGHRLVHGGPDHHRPERVNPALLESLREVVPFAPLHLPAELLGIEAVYARYADLPQIVCYDTAFHWGLPEIARRFPLPRSFYEKGIRRYGFHGLSYEHLVDKLGGALRGLWVLAHLGNGASMVATRDGMPIDTTMGFTPSGGFMMGTRTGDLDPGLLLYLLENGHDATSLERLVNHESGLLAVSGLSSDMKILLERRSRDERVALAFEMFCYQARKAIGALAVALGGLDGLVFTGGIGEHAAPVRERICAGLDFLGVRLDYHLNRADAEIVSTQESSCSVRVVAADEELTIARHARKILFPYGSA
jgi:acetate kinase